MDRRPTIALLLGGFDPPDRPAAIAAGRRPANDVEVLTRRFGARVYDFGWLAAGRSPAQRLLATWARRSGAWSVALALATVREVRRADVVYVSGEDVGIASATLARLVPGGRPRCILRVERHRYGRTRWRRRVHRAAMRAALRGVDVAICRTEGVAARLREDAPPATTITTLGQEIDVEFFAPDRGPGAVLDPDGPVAGIVGAGPYVLTAGLERRDFDTLLDAFAGLDAARGLGVSSPPVGLVVAAGSPWSKDAFATRRELPDVAFVGSFGPGEMRELYRGAAVVVLSVHATERACGMNVVGEAWAMGRPVVASATEGLREFVDDGRNGLLVPPGDPDALRAAIARVLDSPALAARLGSNGRATVTRDLSLRRFADTVGAHIADGRLFRDPIVMESKSMYRRVPAPGGPR